MLAAMLLAVTLLTTVGGETRPALFPKLDGVGWTPPKRLFGPNGPSPDDVFQGDLGDCALMANLSALAEQRPEILTRVVRLTPNGRAQASLRSGVLEFDPALPTLDGKLLFAGDAPLGSYKDPWPQRLARRSAKPTAPLWPEVIERAFATWHGGHAGLEEEILMPLPELLGWAHIALWVPKLEPDDVVKLISAALARHAVVVMGNADPELAVSRGVRRAHAYAILGARSDERRRAPAHASRPEGHTRRPARLRRAAGDVRARRPRRGEDLPAPVDLD